MTINSYLMELQNKGFDPKNILDIGAHHGQFSNFCHSLWPNSKILMIEGNDNCEEVLDKLPFEHCIALLSDENKEVTLYLNNNDHQCTGTSYYKENTRHYKDCLEVKKYTYTLNEIASSLNRTFDLIKIDTQGSELDIIRGGIDVIKNASYIITEVSKIEYNCGSPLFEEVVGYMSDIGFDSYDIIEEHIWNDSLENPSLNGQVFQVDVSFKNQFL